MNSFQRVLQRIAGSVPGAAFFRVTGIGTQDRLLHRMTGGRATITGVFAGFPTLFVTTIGARTGKAHTVALIGVTDPQKVGRVALIASNFGQTFDPDWCHNLRRHPEVTVSSAGVEQHYLASEVTGDDWDRWFHLGTEIYSGYPGYRDRAGRHLPIFELTPADPSPTPIAP